MTVELLTASSPEIVEAMERLIPQLSRSAPALSSEQCEALISQEGVYLFVFRPDAAEGEPASILGMLPIRLRQKHPAQLPRHLGGTRQRHHRVRWAHHQPAL